jgi:mono/diheme cytochrome c family protein
LELAELDLCVMRLKLNGAALQSAVLATLLAGAPPTAAQQPATTPAPDNAPFDVDQLFASTCGFCHSDGGRAPGRGPQLMDSPRDDEFLRTRIKMGKQGAMPAFGDSFSDAQIEEIIKHIRSLKPR